ncbi:hypothetical protein AU255_02530 [Methyloprofundus sedimenti]|uniref:Dockerin domain-containing protein n=1 Tax=Methyloprofundus sedimenti TaxID=1420851 RepID=A0A1V8M5G2_9GAMM|nr:hypothetical protein [Methyloprofundus sedimenti]OQK16801.1 hypothetical protein AU255_02530 [Methyloprofundus sedimenti]
MLINISITQTLSILLMFAFAPMATAASILHLDVEVWGEDGALFAGYCQTPGVAGCDLDGLFAELGLPEDNLPIEAASGKLIFIADFQDLSGGDFKTKNPGFRSVQSALLPNELLSYRALGHLRYWDTMQSAWVQAPEYVQIALYGGLEALDGLATDYAACAGQLLCFDADNFNTESATVFSGDGISGSPELVVDLTNQSGILHTHLSFFLENRQGETGGPTGAYLIEMQLLSNARAIPSTPFLILFNAGLDSRQLSEAISALVATNNTNPPIVTLPDNLVNSLSILGDVDLDGDVDRMDVALILLAEQNREVVQADNIMFDVDGDGLINRQDAHHAKSLCNLRLCRIPEAGQIDPVMQVAVFDSNTGQLALNDVQINTLHYQAVLQQTGENLFTLQTHDSARTRYTLPAKYNAHSGLLEIPALSVENRYFRVILRNIGNFTFQLETIEEIEN